MILEKCPSYMRNRPEFLDRWVAAEVKNTVPEGFAETVRSVSLEQGCNWPFIAAIACRHTSYFGHKVKDHNYFGMGPQGSLESSVRNVCIAGKANPIRFDDRQTRIIYKHLVLWAAQNLKGTPEVTLPPVQPLPGRPEAPRPLPVPTLDPKKPEEGKPDDKAPIKIPWWLRFFKGTIKTSLLALVAWAVVQIPFLAPFVVHIQQFVSALIDAIFH